MEGARTVLDVRKLSQKLQPCLPPLKRERNIDFNQKSLLPLRTVFKETPALLFTLFLVATHTLDALHTPAI